jgi:hypothetical protein
LSEIFKVVRSSTRNSKRSYPNDRSQ